MSYTADQRALGQIRLATQRLAGRYPFHAAILGRFRPVLRPDVRTMGVAVAGDHVRLYYNPEFVLDVPMAQLAGVLLHEVHHVLFGHVLADPQDYPDRWARTIAEEVTVNEFIREPLPASPIVLANFPQLPPIESTDERYRRLEQENRRDVKILDNPGVGRTGCEDLTTVDDHRVWEESTGQRDQATTTVETLIEVSALEVGYDQISDELRASICTHLPGIRSGAVYHQLQQTHRGQINWKLLLRRFTGRLRRRQPSFRRPPRRFPELIGVVPGAYRQTEQPRIMAVLDTSASITPKLLEEMDGELARMASDHCVTVVECDMTIHRVYAYRRLGSVQGRGGTDLRPPFAKKFLGKHRPDLVVYFTDGYGTAPGAAPKLPVIWCLTPNGRVPATWGRVVQMT